MIQIEILGRTRQGVRALFYYQVPADLVQLEASDSLRAPQGTRLSSSEVADLKAGKLIEVNHVEDFPEDVSMPTIQARLQVAWQDRRAAALAAYRKRFSPAGLAFIDGRWQ